MAVAESPTTLEVPGSPHSYRTDLPYVLYIRVSRKGNRDGDSYISPGDQERACRQAARMYGLQVWPQVIFDENKSGGTMDRPGIRKVLDLIRQGKVAGLIVKRFDRFARKTSAALAALEAMEELDAMLLSRDEGWQDLRGDGLIMVVMRAAMAEQERRNRAKYLGEAVSNAVENRGVHLAATYGYRKSAGRGSVLEPDPDEAPVVELMFQLRAAGLVWQRIAEQLNDTGIQPRPHKRDGKVRQGRFTHKTVRQIVHNDVYLGVAYNGDHRHIDAHPPLVSPELHAKANRVKGTTGKPRRKAQDGYLLTGLVRCAGCGYSMACQAAHGINARTYRCRTSQQHAKHCPAPATANADQLEAWIVEQFEAEVLHGDFACVADHEAVRAAEAALKQAKRAYSKVLDLILEADADDDLEELADRKLQRKAGLRDARSDLARAQREAKGADLPDEFGPEAWATMSMADRRQVLSLVYRGAVIQRDTGWRTPVTERVSLLGVSEAPGGTVALIEHIVGTE